MKQQRLNTLIATLFCLTVLATPTQARTITLLESSRICDQNEILCFRGRILFWLNANRLAVDGQVVRTTEPGVLVVRFIGETSLGQIRYQNIDIPLDGTFGEPVDKEIIPPFANTTQWQVDAIFYYPAEAP